MATIEPRLIHLLNGTPTPQAQHSAPQPNPAMSQPATLECPLPPLDLGVSFQPDRYGQYDGPASTSNPSTLSGPHSEVSTLHWKDDARWDARLPAATVPPPFRAFADDTETREPPRLQAGDSGEFLDLLDDAQNKKRRRELLQDDFVQLPQPMKKNKPAQQAPPVVPPIINGLHEPPPHAALFPPIAPTSSNEPGETRMTLLTGLTPVPPGKIALAASSVAHRRSSRNKKQATKPRKKWSEEETKDLLLGVKKYGVGKWTRILVDTSFTFNGRTAADLKDRFRVCCPIEMGATARPSPPKTGGKKGKQKSRSRVHSGNLFADDHRPSSSRGGARNARVRSPKPKRSRAHRKKVEDLAELGIHAPFEKSLRRERCPFTARDDAEILEGLDVYGPAWTKIQRDVRFHLSHRHPTDLRDRVRNKYPDVYRRVEKSAAQGSKDQQASGGGGGGGGGGALEPTVSAATEGESLTGASNFGFRDFQGGQKDAREELYLWPSQLQCASGGPPPLELGEMGAPPSFVGGELESSRFLPDDYRLAQAPNPGAARDAMHGLASPPGYVTDYGADQRGAHSSIRC